MHPLRVCARVLLGVGLVTGAGCNLTNTDPPGSAHFKITTDKPLTLITSTQFTVSVSGVALYKADTIQVSSTQEGTVPLDNPPLFFIRATPSSATSNISMKVDVGSKTWYDASRVVSPPDKLEFAYGFNGGF